MAITELTELHKQEFQSRSTEFSTNGTTAKQVFTIPWEDRYLKGPQIGDTFPEEEGVPLRMWCNRVRHRAIGKDETGTEICLVEVEYSSDQSGIWDTTQELSLAIQQEDIARSRTWTSDDSTNTQAINVDMPVVGFTYTFSRPFMNTALILSAVNTVNSRTFLFGYAGQWKFLGGNITQSRGGLIPYQGGFVQEATYFKHVLQFEFKRTYWNRFWRQDTGEWDTFTDDPYDAFDHNLLLL